MSYELRPLSLAELLDRSFWLYRRHFLLFVGILALPSLVMLMFSVGIQFLDSPPAPTPAGAEADPAQLIGAAVWIGAAFVVMMILYWLTYSAALGATTAAISEIYQGQVPTIAGAYGSMRGKIGRLVWLTFLIFLRLFLVLTALLFITGILVAVFMVVSPIVGGLAAILGFAGSALLFVWITLRYAIAIPPAVLEDATASESIARSIELTSGSLGRVLVLVVFTVIIGYAGLMLFQGPFMLAAMMAGPQTRTGFWLNMSGVITGSIAAALTSPLAVVAMAVLYYDLRIRKEGLDLDLMIAGLRDSSGPAVPPEPGGGYILPG
jgi:Membrane domain of glycerophosphoryl diester phosphodiesterase